MPTNRSGAFHLVQYSGSDSCQFPKAFVVKITHGDPFQLVTDGNPLIGHHEITGVGLFKLRKAVDNSSP